MTTLTPAMQQYHDIKAQYSDCVIFFRMGDFYEMFWDDAHIAHKVLWINITSRNKNAKDPEALAWIPYHAKDKYLPMLVKAWYKVAIVEQVSDPKLKGIVQREVMRVVTPATLNLENDNFDQIQENNTIIAITQSNDGFWLSIIDLSISKWQSAEFQDFPSLAKQLYALNPAEVVLDKSLFQNEEIKNVLQKKYSLNIYYFEGKKDAKTHLLEHFQTKNLIGFWLEWKNLCIASASLLLAYLELNQKQNLQHLASISYLSTSGYLELDESTMKSLDLIYNFSSGSDTLWTLFWVLNYTKTTMGRRFLKQNILRPLSSLEAIQNRQDFISEVLKDKILLDTIRTKLGFICDLDAVLNRLALQRATPRDLLNLKKSLESVVEIFECIEQHPNQKIKHLLNITI